MWNRGREGLDAEAPVTRCFEAIDKEQVVERQADARNLVEPEADARKGILDGWSETFACRDSAIERWRQKRRGWLPGDKAERRSEPLV
jgi:hypothetical protein